MFTSKQVTLIYDNIRKTTISTEDQFTGIMRLALLPPPLKESMGYTSQFPQFYEGVDMESSGVQSLIKYSNMYPVGADVSWNFPSKNIGTINFEFESKPMQESLENELLMLALPHHADAFSSSKSATGKPLDRHEFDLIYKTIKGHMTPIIGSKWSYNEALTSIGFDNPKDDLENAAKLDDQTRFTILDQVAFDVTRVLPTIDENIYGYGKQLARLAQLVHIAHVLVKTSRSGFIESEQYNDRKYDTMIKDATSTLHGLCTAFLKGHNTDILVFDSNFGGLVTRDGLNDFMGEFNQVV